MDFSHAFDLTWDLAMLWGIINIVIIDLVLAGDNAVVIAMAVRNLPDRQRNTGIILGAGAAVALRVVLTFFVAQLLSISFVKLVGGIAIFWIGVKLLKEGVHDEGDGQQASTLWQAIRLIIIADITMSLDNVLAVAGASQGSLFLLLFGLILSIPLVVFASSILSRLMDRYPLIIWIGAAVLGRVAGQMIITDPFVMDLIHPSQALIYGVEAVFTAGVLLLGWLLIKRRRKLAAEQITSENK